MIRNRPILAGLAAAAVLVGGYLAYDEILRGDAVAPLALPSASASSSPALAPSAEPTASAATEPSTGPTTATADADVSGTWTVAADSVAGYRVRERLANLPAESDAVGRTSDVTGSITIEATGDGARLTGGTLTVDTTTIASDEGRRDSRMRTEGLETDRFPIATFTLIEPIEVPATGLAGTPTDLTLVGDLTLHGTTRTVEIPAQAQLADGTISVAGAVSFPLADYGISPPNVGGFILSIADEGALEFLVNFTKG